MKHLLSIFLLSFIFSGELEVDGDLTVTGNIQNQTIESLQTQITNLQLQVITLQQELGLADCYGDLGGSAFFDACGNCVYEINMENCPSLIDIDGNVYGAVQIGNQYWMSENLKVSNYNDGNSVDFMIYDDDANNIQDYGYLYRFYDANDSRGLCPEGWHIPTVNEFDELIAFLGGEVIAGGKMKSIGTLEDDSGKWYSPNSGATNESGFSALPGGWWDSGPSYFLGYRAYFWTSTTNGTGYGWSYRLFYDDVNIESYSDNTNDAYSIRCIQD